MEIRVLSTVSNDLEIQKLTNVHEHGCKVQILFHVKKAKFIIKNIFVFVDGNSISRFELSKMFQGNVMLDYSVSMVRSCLLGPS